MLDLRDLRFPETRTSRIELDQVAGEVIVWLPDDATTDLSVEVVAGTIDLPGGFDDDGVGQQVDRQIVTGTGAADLDLEIDLVAGRVAIHTNADRTPIDVVPSTQPVTPTIAPTPTTPALPTTPSTPGSTAAPAAPATTTTLATGGTR